MFAWLRRRREWDEAVRDEAERLVRTSPKGTAYTQACKALSAAAEGTPEHDRAYAVHRRVRQLVRPGGDTATRMARDAGLI